LTDLLGGEKKQSRLNRRGYGPAPRQKENWVRLTLAWGGEGVRGIHRNRGESSKTDEKRDRKTIKENGERKEEANIEIGNRTEPGPTSSILQKSRGREQAKDPRALIPCWSRRGAVLGVGAGEKKKIGKGKKS